jgi:hypothetical protein
MASRLPLSGRVGASRPLQDRPYPPLANRACDLSPHTALPFFVTCVISVGKRSGMEQMVTRPTEDECFPPSSYHHPLPHRLSLFDIFELTDMMNLKRTLHGFTVFTLPRVQASDQL